MLEPCRLVILISGGGSNLQAFIDAIARGELHARIVAVISNKADVFGLQRAAQAKIPTAVIDHKQFASREAFDAELSSRVASYQPDLVVLAGFMRILTPIFIHPLLGKLINIHPSLLPKYPGLHTHQRALDAGDSEAGATVHFVTEELDGGPAILQASVPILASDDATAIAERVLVQEHCIYPLAAQWFAEGRLQLRDNRSMLDGNPLPPTGFIYKDDRA
ncbi:MAG TPA: phosphoribosylglycinamide formyltransferase [Spongiibacteraceae bacterium]|nr:phosphoribosylglycinamide formyltransferase [Spongiibacteraceae bacterium]